LFSIYCSILSAIFHFQTYCRDVLQEGFPVEDEADAVFLDIPQPDQAIPQAAKALKKSGNIFVPN